jgi:CBS domain-containing protein
VIAADLAEHVTLVTRDTTAVDAARVLADRRGGGLVVADADGVPVALVAGTDLLRLVVPRYVLDDPRLAHVYDEAGAAELVSRLDDHRLGELLDSDDVAMREVPSVLPEDTLIEIAALMCGSRSPLVLVRDRDGTYRGVVTLSRLTAAMLELAGATGGAGGDGA